MNNNNNNNNIIKVNIEIKYNYNNITNKIINNNKENIELTTFSSSVFFNLILTPTLKKFFSKKKLKNNNIELFYTSNTNILTIDSLIDCIKHIENPKENKFNLIHSNLLSYLLSTTIFELFNIREEIFNILIKDINENEIINLFEIANIIKNFDNLNEYCFYLIKYFINKQNNLEGFLYKNINFEDSIFFIERNNFLINTILPFNNNFFPFEFDVKNNKIIYTNINNIKIKISLDFLNDFWEKHIKNYNKFYSINNNFNIGKILRRKSPMDIVTDLDYPHYYTLILENEKDFKLYAIKEKENTNFIISLNQYEYIKYSYNYIGEIEINFWGTGFTVYDCGYNESFLNDKNKLKFLPLRKKLCYIKYDLNIFGAIPRNFYIDIYKTNEENNNNNTIHLINLKPYWNELKNSYCLNFYGRVKNASNKNFQIIEENDEDNILLQHGKNKSNEYNIDFRDPFSSLIAFSISLTSLEYKNLVS